MPCVSGLVENTFKEFKMGPIVNTKQIYHYCPQLNNYRTILECKVSNKKIKFISPTLSSSSRKVNQNHLTEVCKNCMERKVSVEIKTNDFFTFSWN